MNNIAKNIKMLFTSFLIVFLMTANVYAETAPAKTIEDQTSKSEEVERIITEQLKINTLDELQKDLSNRLILGIFGKDALIYSLGTNVSEGVIAEISMLSMSEVQEYAKPFNIGNLNGFLMILSSFFFVAFSVLAMYFCWVMFEALFNTQDSGEFFGQRTSTLFSVLKGSTAMVLIIPAYGFSHKPFSDFKNSIDGTEYGSFSIAQLAVFKAMGLSNQFANHIWGSFVNNYQKAYPTLVLPNTYSKESEMKEILNFVMCVKAYNSGQDSNVGFKRTHDSPGNYQFRSRFKKCLLEGKIKYNASTIKELKDDTSFSKMVNDTVDYEKLFTETINRTLKDTFERADLYADILLRESSQLTDSLEKTGALVNPTNWRELCATPEGMLSKGKLNSASLPLIQYYMEKCLSETFILSFIAKDINIARNSYDSKVLSGYNIALCDDELAQQNGNRTFVKTSDIGTSENATSKTLDQCLIDSCSAEGGLYQCTSAIEFVKTSSENERMIKQGWLTAGAYSYALFSGFTNNASQEIINSLSASFSIKPSKRIIRHYTGDFNYKINSKSPTNTNVYEAFIKITDMTINSKDLLNAKKDTVALLMPSGGFAGKHNPDGMFGIYKFVTCSSNPMTITKGYTCGNVTEEMHDMGAKMVAMAIEIKIASTAAQLFGFTKSRSPTTSAQASGKKISKFASMLNTSANFYGPILKILGIGGASAMATGTAFSSIDSYWMQNPEVYIALIALFTGEIEFMITFMDYLFGILILLGLVFGFVLPLLPYFLWILVIAGWATMILESLIVAPVWAATLISPSNDHTSRTAKKGLLIIMTIMMRAPFMVIGLVLAWLLSNALIGSLLEIANISDALLLSNSSGVDGYIDLFVKLIVYVSLVYFIYNLVFSIIEGFYEIGSNWLFGSSLSPFAAKDRSEKWRSGFASAKKFTGVKG